jgi:hypothetical protein
MASTRNETASRSSGAAAKCSPLSYTQVACVLAWVSFSFAVVTAITDPCLSVGCSRGSLLVRDTSIVPLGYQRCETAIGYGEGSEWLDPERGLSLLV